MLLLQTVAFFCIVMAKESFEASLTTQKTKLKCEESYIVNTEAILLQIPKGVISCFWFIQANHPTQTIGVSVVNLVIKYTELENMTSPFPSLVIQDGKKQNNEGRHLNLRKFNICSQNLHYLFTPTNSMSDSLFIKYLGTNQSIISFNLLVYACGGIAQPGVPFLSPNFSSSNDLPDQIKCKWTFKPYQDHQRKARIFQLKVNRYVNELCLNISRQDDGLFYNMSMMRLHKSNNKLETKYDPLTNISEPTVISDTSVRFCQHDNYTLGFSSNRVEVVYDVLQPRSEFVLNATFSHPPFYRKNKTKKWFVKYVNLIVFIPIAFLAGFILICYQQRRHIAENKFNAMKNNDYKNSQENTKFIESSSKRTIKNENFDRIKTKENGELEDSGANSSHVTYITNKTIIKLNQKPDKSSQQLKSPKRVSFR